MIDWIKLKIYLSVEDREKLKVKGSIKKTESYSSKTNSRLEFIREYYGKVYPSYNRDIRWTYEPTKEFIWIEFNPSKTYYGHNLLRINVEQFIEVLENFKECFRNAYDVDLGELNEWVIVRIDICASFRKDRNLTLSIINSIKSIDNKIRPKIIENCVYFTASDSYSFKAYDKFPEFKKHDYTNLKRDEEKQELAKRLLNFSNGILIAEIMVRERSFKRVFGVPDMTVGTLRDKINLKEVIQKEICKFITPVKLLKNMDKKHIFEIMENRLGSTSEAVNLFYYYKLMTSDNPLEQWLWNDKISRQVRSRVRQQLKKIGLEKELEKEIKEVKYPLSLDDESYLGSPSVEEAEKMVDAVFIKTINPFTS